MHTSPAVTASDSSVQPKSGLIWLASYPKSGNTWARMFLSNLAAIMAGEGEGSDLKSIARFSHSANYQTYFEDILGFKPTARHADEIAAARAKVQQKIADAHEGLVILKTHNALANDRGYPLFNFAVTSGAVYIVRNPLDVAISLAHHGGDSLDRAIEVMASESVGTPVDETFVNEIWSSWSRHVSSWTRKSHPAILVMRYEDMLTDPQSSFAGLARHLRLDATPDQLALAIERSSFDELQDEEERAGFQERPQQAERFFREGRSGQWRDVLAAQQVGRVVAAHHEQMARFGYWPLD